MLSWEEARDLAAKRLRDLCECTEYHNAFVFANPRSKDCEGGPDAPVAVLKDSGKICGFTSYLFDLGGGKRIRRIRF